MAIWHCIAFRCFLFGRKHSLFLFSAPIKCLFDKVPLETENVIFFSVREIHHQNDRSDSKNCYSEWRWNIFIVFNLIDSWFLWFSFSFFFFLTKNSPKQYEEIYQTNYCNLIFYYFSQVSFLHFFRFHNSFLPPRSQNVILQPNKTVPPN